MNYVFVADFIYFNDKITIQLMTFRKIQNTISFEFPKSVKYQYDNLPENVICNRNRDNLVHGRKLKRIFKKIITKMGSTL